MAGLSQSFIDEIVAVEDAAALLAEARRSGSKNLARDGAARGARCTPLLIEAADLLTALGEPAEALVILRGGLGLTGPTAPLQHAYARHCRAAGDLDEAARWMQGAMLRARATAAMAFELCEIEYARADPQAAQDALTLAVRLRWLDPEGLRSAFQRLADAGHGAAAIVPAMMLHQRGADDPALRRTLADLFQICDPCSELPEPVVSAMRLDDPVTMLHLAGSAAHDSLLEGFDTAGTIDRARRREASDRWIAEPDLWDFLRRRIERGEPFSFVRMSDGEGRFVAGARPALFPWLEARNARAMLAQIWMNWFGQDVDLAAPERLSALVDAFETAIRNAGLVGRTSAAMYEHDRRHFGYRAALDDWIDRPRSAASGSAPANAQYHTEALNALLLSRHDPFLAKLLAGQDFIGAISPHAGLAGRLALEIGATHHRDHVIPGETRLGRAQERADRGAHFPMVFDRMMAEIAVPHRGACFVVAGGLLGKIYCERIRQLGGIALDIGAVADGWMGFNTRGEGFQTAEPPTP